MNQKWNAEKYGENFKFVHQYGNDVMSLIDFEDISSVLDLGCGNGALIKSFTDRGLKTIGIDGSAEMIAAAKLHCPDGEFFCDDACDFSLKNYVDVVFSNAVFHWIDKNKQQDMMKCVCNALRNGGQFVFEMGGFGNTQLIHQALRTSFAEYGYNYEMNFYFPTISEYSSMLEKNGFLVKYAALFERPTVLKGENGMSDWLEMFTKNSFLNVSEQDSKAVIKRAVELLKNDLLKDGIWYADYVRLRMKAIKI